MKLYKTTDGILLEADGGFFVVDEQWDELINRDNLQDYLRTKITGASRVMLEELPQDMAVAPIGRQEVWAAGVTYLKSRDARMEESHDSGAASLYDRVYDADRPEIFFKATPARVAGHNEELYIRKDSTWNVPEPELTLFINSNGNIQGYTIGNDMSSRSIEGENALYLPQAKTYEKCAGLGPALCVTPTINSETRIAIAIHRDGDVVYEDTIAISRMKRTFTELAGYLFRECFFEHGVYLMTGTGLVPGPDFTLQQGDIIEITIDGVGTLINRVALNPKHT